MCGRYRIKAGWLYDLPPWPVLPLDRLPNQPDLFAERKEIFPRTFQPIIRLDEAGTPTVELRRWGFHRTWPDKSKPDIWVKRELINAVGATVDRLPTFRKAFKEHRCLVPMSAWWEWPVVDGVKVRTEIAMKEHPVFMAAGLYETSKDNKTGEPVETFTIVTTEPNELLGSVHDRAPLVLTRPDWDAWLESPEAAKDAIHPYPNLDDFVFRTV